MAVPRKLLGVASHLRDMPWSTECQMAIDESDEGSHLEVKSNSIFGLLLLSRLTAEENKPVRFIFLPYKIPRIFYSFNEGQEVESN